MKYTSAGETSAHGMENCVTNPMTLSFSKAKQLKKAPKKAVKKVKKSTLRNKADKLFSLYVRLEGKCQANTFWGVRCGGSLQCAHITTRGVTALRFDEMNALCLCAGHHRFFTHHPLEWVIFLKDSYPMKLEYVIKHKNDKVKKTEDLYREVIARYSKEEKV